MSYQDNDHGLVTMKDRSFLMSSTSSSTSRLDSCSSKVSYLRSKLCVTKSANLPFDYDATFEKWPTFGKHEFIFSSSRIESSLKPSLPSSTIQDCGILSPENSDHCSSSEFKLFTEEELLAKDFGDDFEPLDQLT